MEEFDVALCFHWGRHTEEDSAQLSGKYQQDTIYTRYYYNHDYTLFQRVYVRYEYVNGKKKLTL